jgi:hypothetical protein
MQTYFWWCKHVSIALLSAAFLAFGAQVLIAAYGLGNPLTFIMTFFSASLMILISLVGILYPVIRVMALLKSKR